MARLAPLALLAFTACASAQRPAARCAETWDHVHATLQAGLSRYVGDLDRYVTATVPGARTTAAQARARTADAAWAGAQRGPFLARCEAAPAEERRCASAASAAADLPACGLGALVQSYTDEVLPAFSEAPIDRAPPPR